MSKVILDACCGSRMCWFDKEHPAAVYMDCRELETELCDGRKLVIRPDVVGDFRAMPFADCSFRLVVFDPPHLRWCGEGSWMKAKYGQLNRETWQDDLRRGFAECFRVLMPHGVLVFKWNERQVKLNEVVKLAPMPPLFGQRAGKTHWLVFMKPMPEALEHPGMDEEQAQETVCALENVVHDLVHGKTHAPSQVLQSRDFDIE
ncbi:MAG: class I SAM-dependent methyltransferase [Akkermansia sp.]|nr:class I SAM-dependent methyltransferase [Akkermansia sp.]